MSNVKSTGQNSKVFIDVKKEKKDTFRFTQPGKYVVFLHNVSGKFTFDIAGAGIDLDILGLFIGKGEDKFTIHTIQRHSAPRSSSNLFIKGVFEGESKFHHEGLIRIEKKAQKSKAYQKNQSLIFDKAFVESEPFLEILANDVFCTHGSTTGKLSAEQIYFLMSRGIEKKAAEKFLVKGFINEIVEKVVPYGIQIKQ